MKRKLSQDSSNSLFDEDNGASPVLRKERLQPGGDISDSDDEVIITSQANKRRKWGTTLPSGYGSETNSRST